MASFPSVQVESDSDDDYLVNIRPDTRRRKPLSAPAPSLPLSKKKNKDAEKVKPGSFQALGLSEPLCASFSRAGYGFPTAVQRKTIPAVLSRRDVVVMARTGAGKTAAFLAPLLDILSDTPADTTCTSNGPRALILAPTRELALQTFKFFRLYTRDYPTPIRAAVLVGGTPLDAQFDALSVCPDLLIATPGRCLQLLAEMGSYRSIGLTLSTAQMVVFDEADRLFEGTLASETDAILNHIGKPAIGITVARQTVLVSATMPTALVEFSRTGLRNNVEVIRMDSHDALPPTLAVGFVCTRGNDSKDAALIIALRKAADIKASTLVFAATHRSVEYLVELLRKTLAVNVDAVHGSMDQGARVESVARFRKKQTKILVVTDVAARGIDLPELDLVINYDFPATPKLFVHRVGRAARAGRPGRALSLVATDEAPYMLDTHLFLARGVQLAKGDDQNEAWKSLDVALKSSFLFGELPKEPLDEEVELLRKNIDDVDIEQLRTSSNNAHGLYIRTRSVASGESVARAKKMFRGDNGGRKRLKVHPWFADMESEGELKASVMASEVSAWRPKYSAVPIPQSLRERKRKREERKAIMEKIHKPQQNAEDEDEDLVLRDERGTVDVSSKEAKMKLKAQDKVHAAAAEKIMKRPRKKARQMAMEEQRAQFFVPTQRSTTPTACVNGNKKNNSNNASAEVAEGFGAFRAIQSAAMDLAADNNVDLLRNKHIAAGGKYWDRVSKKFVKGGLHSATSKSRNLHVTTREAKAKAQGTLDYTLGDGVMYKKWIAKNKKAVEQRREALETGDDGDGPIQVVGRGNSTGMGSNDYRKGAIGRRARVIAAGKAKAAGTGTGSSGGKYELKTAEEIKKVRKLKKKREFKEEQKRRGKRVSKSNGRGRGGGGGMAMQSRSSKVRIISHGKK